MKIEFDNIKSELPRISIKLTHSKKKAKSIIEKMCGKAEAEDWGKYRDNKDATVSCLQHECGDVVYLVWMNPCLDRSAADDAAVLAHEATHVTIDYLKNIVGEDQPSEELKAYTVQTVTKYLCKKHFKWKKKQLE